MIRSRQGGNVYQWRVYNGSTWVDVAGANQSSFTPTSAGTYYCVITNACGSVQSSFATAYTTPSKPVIVVYGPTTVNAGDPVTFGVDWSSCDSCTQFQWLPSYYITTYHYVTFYPDQTTTYSVIGYNAGYCHSQSDPVTITVIP